MSIFKSKGIVLKIIKIGEKESLFQIFFLDYGLLSVKKKKKSREKAIDIWQLISCEIITHNTREIHSIWNIKITAFFYAENTPYENIELYLKLLSYLKQEIPQWNPHAEIFESIEIFLLSSQQSRESLILLFLKVQDILWNLQIENSDEIIRKILKFISLRHYREIIKLKNIPEDTLKKLEQML